MVHFKTCVPPLGPLGPSLSRPIFSIRAKALDEIRPQPPPTPTTYLGNKNQLGVTLDYVCSVSYTHPKSMSGARLLLPVSTEVSGIALEHQLSKCGQGPLGVPQVLSDENKVNTVFIII